ncbi:MAG TPA: glutamate-1-semialdehyde 2,1-aminomutase [Dehalococcoidia bacterium]|nr:glutamate-1-semialdehyde 2,1-aminomutase [Dehalococcoidia bacterium]
MANSRKRSLESFAAAQSYLVGGVSSPVRAFRAVGGQPLVIQRGEGARIYDVDGNQYIDYVAAFGPLILGHANPQVLAAVQAAAVKGTAYGATTELEIELARLVCEAFPSIDLLRFVNSGTEATMSALRLARAFTGRSKVLKFEGCYHGHADGLLVRAGSGVATLSLPDSAGVPEAYSSETLVAPYNDLAAAQAIFEKWGEEIAAVILEPVAGNMGVVPPAPGYLEGLRRLTRDFGALLVFDEVITGFRLRYGGVQEQFGVTADLTCLGKIIGGGLPVGAYGGRREIMELLAPLGPVYQAGTLSGNPLAMAAGVATLNRLRQPGVYEQLDELGALLAAGLRQTIAAATRPGTINQVGSLITLFFSEGNVSDYTTAKKADISRYAAFFRSMLGRGIFLPPSQFESWFISLAHSRRDIEKTVKAAGEALTQTLA